MRKFMTVLAFIAAPSIAMSHDFKVGDLVVDHPVANTTPARAMTGAGYLSIKNNGDTADSLIGVEADFPRVMLHDTVVENDIASMSHIEAAEIAPGETLTFEPGGKHIMFMGLDGDPFEEGETFDATLIFEKAGRVDVEFVVEDLSDGHGDHGDHGDHDHGDHDDHSDHDH